MATQEHQLTGKIGGEGGEISAENKELASAE